MVLKKSIAENHSENTPVLFVSFRNNQSPVTFPNLADWSVEVGTPIFFDQAICRSEGRLLNLLDLYCLVVGLRTVGKVMEIVPLPESAHPVCC